MNVQVRNLKDGKVKKMAKTYADILVKLKRVEIVQEKPVFNPAPFQQTIVTKPITSTDTIKKEEKEEKKEEKKQEPKKEETAKKSEPKGLDWIKPAASAKPEEVKITKIEETGKTDKSSD